MAGIPTSAIAAVVINVTATQPTTAGWIAVYADGTPPPPTSNLNFTANQTVPNLVIAPIGADGRITLHNGSNGAVHLVADVSGYILGASSPGWSAQVPSTGQAIELSAVSCPAEAGCGAIGSAANVNGRYPVVASSNAGIWSIVDAPLPADAGPNVDADLLSIDCPIAGSCFAVGNYTNSLGQQRPLVDALSGGVWSAATTALPGDAVAGSTGTSLSSVSCSSSTSCAAVGPYVGPAGHQEAFAARLISGSWSNATRLQPPAGVTSTEEFANVIDCSGTTCVTPFSVRTNGTGVGYLALLGAGAWTITKAPLPPGASSGGVDAVSCASSTVCTGVGQYAVDTSTGGVASEQDHGLAETLSGGTWVASSVDTVGANATYLYGLDCPSTGFCAAIGIGADFGSVLLVESNGVWSATAAPVPTNGTAVNAPTSISCGAAGSCSAIGDYIDSAGRQLGIAEMYANGTWTASPTARPSDTDDRWLALNAISCVGPHSYCVAVGVRSTAEWTVTSVIETYAATG